MTPPQQAPIISALIPTYRRPRLLERAVRSILSQTYTAVQACVFDNASGDGTRSSMEALSARDPRLLYHCHPSNLGGGANFNLAIASVKTPFFSLLSDDDLLVPEAYETAMAAFREHPRAGFVVLDTLILSSWGDLSVNPALREHSGLLETEARLLALLDHGPPTWTGVVFRSELLRDLVELKLDCGCAPDLDFLLRAASLGPFAVKHVPGAIYTHDSIALGRLIRGTHEGFWPGWMIMVDRICGNPRLSAETSEELRRRLIALLAFNLSVSAVSGVIRGDFQEAAEGADILKHELGMRLRGATLKALSQFCRRLPYLHEAIVALFQARVMARHAWRESQDSYRSYVPLIGP